MKSWEWYWVVWVAAGFGVPEAVGVFSPTFPTLSETWRHLTEAVPVWASVGLHAAVAAACLWLLGAHWVFVRRGALDDIAAVVVGILLGVTAATHKRRRDPWTRQ